MRILFLIAYFTNMINFIFSKQIRIPRIQRSTLVFRNLTPSGSSITTINTDRDNVSSSTVEVGGGPISSGNVIVETLSSPSGRSTRTRSTSSVTGRGGSLSISSYGSSSAISSSLSTLEDASNPAESAVNIEPEITEISYPAYNNTTDVNRTDGSIGNMTFTMSDFNENSIPTALPEYIAIPFAMTWKILPIETKHFNINYGGLVYAINSTDHKLYYYDELRNIFTLFQSFQNSSMNISHVFVSPDNIPYIIDNKGNTFFQKNNSWKQLPGCASRIGLGRNGELFKLGCDKKDGGYDVYMLQCTDGNKFVYNFPHLLDDSVFCDWFSLNGRAIKVAVLNNGLPLIITEDEQLFYFTGDKWNSFMGMEGKDVAVSNSGLLLLIDIQNELYAINNAKYPMKVYLLGKAKTVSIGPFSIPVILGVDDVLYMADKLLLE
jgi:hypothetical protein